jgi:hypothetical protein
VISTRNIDQTMDDTGRERALGRIN